jgi:transcriptional regulator NrdR family protein
MLKCPSCGSVSFVSTGVGQEKIPDAPSVETRNKEQNPYIRRRRRCKKCNQLFSTREYEVGQLQSIMLAVKEEFSTLKGSEKRLDSLVVDIEDLLEELLSWAGHVKKQKKLLKQRRTTDAN